MSQPNLDLALQLLFQSQGPDADSIEDNYELYHQAKVDNFIDAAGYLDLAERNLVSRLTTLDSESKSEIISGLKGLFADNESKYADIDSVLSNIEKSAYSRLTTLEKEMIGDNSDIAYLLKTLKQIEVFYKENRDDNGRLSTRNSQSGSMLIDIKNRFPDFAYKASFDNTRNWYNFYRSCKAQLTKTLPQFEHVDRLNGILVNIAQCREIINSLIEQYPSISKTSSTPFSLTDSVDTTLLFNLIKGASGELKSLESVGIFFGINFAKIRRSSKVFTNFFEEGVDYTEKNGYRRYTETGLKRQLDLYKKYVEYEEMYLKHFEDKKTGWAFDTQSQFDVFGEIALLNITNTDVIKSSAINAAAGYLDKRKEKKEIDSLLQTIEKDKSEFKQGSKQYEELSLQETFIRNYFLKEKSAASLGTIYTNNLKNAIKKFEDFNIKLSEAIKNTNDPFTLYIYSTVHSHLPEDITLRQFFESVSLSYGVTRRKILEQQPPVNPTDITPEAAAEATKASTIKVFEYNETRNKSLKDKLDLINEWLDLAKLNSTSISLGYVLDKRTNITTSDRTGVVSGKPILGKSLRQELSEIYSSTEYFGAFTSVRDFIASLGDEEELDMDLSLQTNLLQLQVDSLIQMKNMYLSTETLNEDKEIIAKIIEGLSKDYQNTPLGYVFSTAKVALIDNEDNLEVRNKFSKTIEKLKKALDERNSQIKKAKPTKRSDEQ